MKRQSLLQAFQVAFKGIGHFFMNDRNGNIHLTITLLVSAAGYYFQISIIEWCIVLLCVALVFGLEMLNHAMEKLCDTVHPTQHPFIKVTKDVAAGAVLWSAIISVIIGLMIFLPKIFL
jgi:undecaprenol kinase/diacylglycerol kinase (ATP)